MNIVNEHGKPIDTSYWERDEQALANLLIQPNDIVLELGARYGSVSCIINSKLAYKTNQVVVEPDERVWDALEVNKKTNNCEFHIIKGFLSSKKLGLTNLDDWQGYGSTSVEDTTTTIPSYSLQQIQEKYGLSFNVLVADCEGFLETFFDENPTFYDNLRLVIFEADYPEKCNYDKIKARLAELEFRNLLSGHQNVWFRPDSD